MFLTMKNEMGVLKWSSRFWKVSDPLLLIRYEPLLLSRIIWGVSWSGGRKGSPKIKNFIRRRKKTHFVLIDYNKHDSPLIKPVLFCFNSIDKTECRWTGESNLVFIYNNNWTIKCFPWQSNCCEFNLWNCD